MFIDPPPYRKTAERGRSTVRKRTRENLGKLLPAIFCDFEGKPERFSPRGGIFSCTHIAIMPPLHPFRKPRYRQIGGKST